MATNTLRYNRSGEVLGHIDPNMSNFANARYAQTSIHSHTYEEVTPQTQQTAFGLTHTFTLYKHEAIISCLKWKCTVSALTPSAGARDAFNYLRWKRWAPMAGIESVKIVFGNEPAETYPGYWIWLQNVFMEDVDTRQREDVWDLTDAERDSLSAGAATFYLDLKPFFLRHPGMYLPTHALRESFRILITTRALAYWIDSNMGGSPSATITSDVLQVTYTVLPPAELATYIERPWRIPMKTVSLIEQETITAATRHSVLLTYKGTIEGYFIGLRSSNLALANNDTIQMDHVNGLTISYSINNQPAINAADANLFRWESMRYLDHRPSEVDRMNWLYVPISLGAHKVASAGVVDHNTPSRIEMILNFSSAFTGDVTIVSPVRNAFVIRSGKAQKKYS